jgi:hypothetical protein
VKERSFFTKDMEVIAGTKRRFSGFKIMRIWEEYLQHGI